MTLDKKIGVAKEHLKAAVRKVGAHAEDVAIELDAKWHEEDMFRVIKVEKLNRN